MGLTTTASVDHHSDVSASHIYVTPPTTMAPALTEPETQKTRLSDQTTGAAPVQPLADQANQANQTFQNSFLNSPILTNSNNNSSNVNNNRQSSLRKVKSTPPKSTIVASDQAKFGASNEHIHMEAKQDLSSAPVNTSAAEPTTSQSILRPSEEERKEIANSIMGLQKDYQPDVEQMLGELATGEIELLQQVFKSLEQVGATPAGDGGLCDLGGGLSLFNDVDVMNMCDDVVQSTPPNKDKETLEIQEEIEKIQAQMQRKCDFLIRRLRKLQARSMGQHASEEIFGLFEHSQRHCKKKDKEFNMQQKQAAQATPQSGTTSNAIPDIIPYQPPPQPVSVEKLRPLSALAIRNFIRRVESTATNQHQNASKRLQSAKFFSTLHQPLESKPHHGQQALVPQFDDAAVDQMDQVSGMLHTELKLIETSIDSEATESSSGGESADEMVSYGNLEQQSLSITNRAAWRWARDRGSIASRWSWLLAQISDLEYRIRQHNELYNQIKKNKGVVTFDDVAATPSTDDDIPKQPSNQSVNGYRGVLPGSSAKLSGSGDTEMAGPNGAYDPNASLGASRTRPFHRAGFRKRKLMQTANLHTISKKAAKSSSVKCGCQWPLHPCALCTGRIDPTSPRDIPDTMPASERIALLDPCYHPVLSLPEDVSHSIHFEAIMRVTEWQNKVVRCTAKSAIKQATMLGTTKAERATSKGDDDVMTVTSSKKYGADGKRKYKKYKTHGLVSKLKKAKTRRGLHQTSATTTGTNYLKTNHNNHKQQRKLLGLASNQTTPLAHGSATTMALSQMDGDLRSTGANNSSHSLNSSNNGWVSGSGHVNNVARSKNSSPTSFNYKNERYCSDLRRSRNSYDIDNIVIPYSVAAATRVEVLPYKEIITPKWRVVTNDDTEPGTVPPPSKIKVTNNGSRQPSSQPDTPQQFNSDEYEDISDEVMQAKHERALLEERKKFQSFLKFPYSSRSRANRRIDSRAESSGTNTPDQPPSPAAGIITPLNTTIGGDQESIPSPFASMPQTPLDGNELSESSVAQALAQTATSLLAGRERRRTTSSKFKTEVSREEIVRSFTPEIKETFPPFEPLQFPLTDDMYDEMLQQMPDNHLNLVDEIFSDQPPGVAIATLNNATPVDVVPRDVVASGTVTTNTLFDDTRSTTYTLNNWSKNNSATQPLVFATDKPRKPATKNRLEKLLDDEDDYEEDTSSRSIDSETESISDLPDGYEDDDPDDPEYRVPVKHLRT